MEFSFQKMSQSELIKYVNSFDFQSEENFQSSELVWSFNPQFLLRNVNIPALKSQNDWVAWINNEQEAFIKEMEYDRYKSIEEAWILNPVQEPIIIIQRLDGTHDISDGWHRTGLAHRNNLETIPVILGIKKIIS
jgi:hypothetical protein